MGTPGTVGLTQRATSLRAFAGAMRASDAGFADRLDGFAARFGPLTDDGLALLSQAAYFCWFHVEYQANLLATCRAIGADRPSYLYLCGHLSPLRWRSLHAYVVGVQRWLGVNHPVPGLVDAERVAQVGRWLGQPTPVRRSLARLFLGQLVDHLTRRTTFSVLTDGAAPDASEYPDFGQWYTRADGTDSRICADEIRREVADMPGVADDREAIDELITGIASPSQPPCMHRFERYQDIALISIGHLRWRAGLPPDPSRQLWEEFWSVAEAGLRAWLDGQSADDPGADDPVGGALHEALGTPTPRSRAIVADFLLEPPPGEGCFSWLLEEARVSGLMPTAGRQECAAETTQGDATEPGVAPS